MTRTLPHPSFFVPGVAKTAAPGQGAPMRTRRREPTWLPTPSAIAWLGQNQPALLGMLHGKTPQWEVSAQLVTHFLMQVAGQQTVPQMSATALEHAFATLPAEVDGTILKWVDRSLETLANAVAGQNEYPANYAELRADRSMQIAVARVLQATVQVLLAAGDSGLASFG